MGALKSANKKRLLSFFFTEFKWALMGFSFSFSV